MQLIPLELDISHYTRLVQKQCQIFCAGNAGKGLGGQYIGGKTSGTPYATGYIKP